MRKIAIFIDETGNIQDPTDENHYGLGFVYIPHENIRSLEQILKLHKLEKIHVKEISGKVELAKKVSELQLEQFNLKGGAIIRTDGRHMLQVANNSIWNQIIDRPWLAQLGIQQAPKRTRKKLESKPIVLINEIFPKLFKNSRVYEFIGMAMRFPILCILDEYGISDLEIKISSIGSSEKYGSKMKASLEQVEKGLNLFLTEISTTKQFSKSLGSGETGKLKIDIVESSDMLFGLADLFASVGHHLASDLKKDSPTNNGIRMHDELIKLFASFDGASELEYRKGIQFR